MSIADLYDGIEDAPVIAHVTESQPSPQEFDCGCVALYWVDDCGPGGAWDRQLRLAHACGTDACEVTASVARGNETRGPSNPHTR